MSEIENCCVPFDLHHVTVGIVDAYKNRDSVVELIQYGEGIRSRIARHGTYFSFNMNWCLYFGVSDESLNLAQAVLERYPQKMLVAEAIFSLPQEMPTLAKHLVQELYGADICNFVGQLKAPLPALYVLFVNEDDPCEAQRAASMLKPVKYDVVLKPIAKLEGRTAIQPQTRTKFIETPANPFLNGIGGNNVARLLPLNVRDRAQAAKLRTTMQTHVVKTQVDGHDAVIIGHPDDGDAKEMKQLVSIDFSGIPMQSPPDNSLIRQLTVPNVAEQFRSKYAQPQVLAVPQATANELMITTLIASSHPAEVFGQDRLRFIWFENYVIGPETRHIVIGVTQLSVRIVEYSWSLPDTFAVHEVASCFTELKKLESPSGWSGVRYLTHLLGQEDITELFRDQKTIWVIAKQKDVMAPKDYWNGQRWSDQIKSDCLQIMKRKGVKQQLMIGEYQLNEEASFQMFHTFANISSIAHEFLRRGHYSQKDVNFNKQLFALAIAYNNAFDYEQFCHQLLEFYLTKIELQSVSLKDVIFDLFDQQNLYQKLKKPSSQETDVSIFTYSKIMSE